MVYKREKESRFLVKSQIIDSYYFIRAYKHDLIMILQPKIKKKKLRKRKERINKQVALTTN